MRLSWNGKDITASCAITGCVHRDAAGGRSDSLELQMDQASKWYGWGPEEGDVIEVSEGTWRTGKLYLTAIIPAGGQYRVLASAVTPRAARKAWAGFQNISFTRLLERCAAECGMGGRIFGLQDHLIIPYAMRAGEGCAAFLDRIGRMEGFRIKAFDGDFRAIYLPYAEEMEADVKIRLTAGNGSATYRRRDNIRYSGLTVMSPWAQATARDAAATGNNHPILTALPARTAIQAGRWARNLLADHNRTAEEITLEQRLDTRMAALARVDITGGTDMDGEWIVEEAEHDLKGKTTRSRMTRVIRTVR